MSEKFLELIAKSDRATNQKAEVILDTNVMLEVYSIGALLRLGEELGTPEAALASPKYKYRLLRARHSILLAWWLGQNGRVVGLFGNEVVDQLELMAPKVGPGEDGTSYIITTAIVHVVSPLVLSWKVGALTDVDHNAKGTKADTEILSQAAGDAVLGRVADEKTPLVTNEGLTETGINDDPKKLRARAIAAGVKVYTPKEYLDADGIDSAQEGQRFLDALAQAVVHAKENDILHGHEVLDELIPLYRHILRGEVADKYQHHQHLLST